MNNILNGKKIADEIKSDLARKIFKLKKKPGLAAILVGDDVASAVYIRLKEKACREVGMEFHKYLCGKECNEAEVIEAINFLNNDKAVDGIIVQLPLPDGFDTNKIINTIDPNKDVDGFISKNVIPPTISAVIELLKATEEKLENKKTLIVGKSDVFTSGMEDYLKSELKIKSVKIENKIPKDSNQYDVVVMALGQAHALKKKDIKSERILIDVGINKLDDKTVGDIDPECYENANYFSPVPGGVGPLTVACLLRNTYELSIKKS